ncbi:MAG: hypothetical protein OXR82_01650 [Gammaproteobacteria bacterium]|nr:hypothetical protein [Gammaproteobacteria bacterium]MDE0257079.1 hypothetical protein [Gammaproteobacteria bacterium]
MTFRTNRIRTLDEVRAFLEGNEATDITLHDRQQAYAFIERTLVRFRYHFGLSRAGKARLHGHSEARRVLRNDCAREARGGPQSPEEDVEASTGTPGLVVEEASEALGHREHELAHRDVGGRRDPPGGRVASRTARQIIA